jgi:hypothetical protein
MREGCRCLSISKSLCRTGQLHGLPIFAPSHSLYSTRSELAECRPALMGLMHLPLVALVMVLDILDQFVDDALHCDEGIGSIGSRSFD